MTMTETEAEQALNYIERRTGSADLRNVLQALIDGDFPQVGDNDVTASAAELNLLDDAAANVTIGLAASATTDGMDVTITVVDAAGNAIDAIHALEVWISESAAGAGLTADSTATVTVPTTGTLLDELTDDKHFTILTAATGVAVMLVVDSNNPADQYIAVKHPLTGKVIVSSASGTNWEGA